jgi:hypothetical protein
MSEDKIWIVGDHRVKEVQTYRLVHPDGEMSHQVPDGTDYRCIDCDRQFKEREEFKDAECYEVIIDGISN